MKKIIKCNLEAGLLLSSMVHGVIPREVARANAKSQPVLVCHVRTWSRLIGSVVGWIDLPMEFAFTIAPRAKYLISPCLVQKKVSKKCYSSYHIESYDTCMEH